MRDRHEKIVAHVGDVSESVNLDAIHLHRLERDIWRQRLKWIAIIVALSLIAAVLIFFGGGYWIAPGGSSHTAPSYEPKDEARQQYLERTERARQE